jgi:hypothetical protein
VRVGDFVDALVRPPHDRRVERLDRIRDVR